MDNSKTVIQQLTDNNEKMLEINGQILYQNYQLLQRQQRFRWVMVFLLIIILVLLIF
ncbi:MAG: hypothetical protein GY782_08575 [Gammaproteobacteria bacterium]|nr:hypothetical protein [Gammaproteobacteria bacterium]